MSVWGYTDPTVDGLTEFDAQVMRLMDLSLAAGHSLAKLSAYVDALGDGTGDQQLQPVVYARDGKLLATGTAVTIPDGSAAAWRDFTFPTPVTLPPLVRVGLLGLTPTRAARLGHRLVTAANRRSERPAYAPVTSVNLLPTISGADGGNMEAGAGNFQAAGGAFLGRRVNEWRASGDASARFVDRGIGGISTVTAAQTLASGKRYRVQMAVNVSSLLTASGSPTPLVVEAIERITPLANMTAGAVTHTGPSITTTGEKRVEFVTGVTANPYLQVRITAASGTGVLDFAIDDVRIEEVAAGIPASDYAGSRTVMVGDFAIRLLTSEVWTPATGALADEDLARLPYPESQRIFGARLPETGAGYRATCGWHGTSFDPEQGAFGIVNPDGPLADLLGEVVCVTYQGRETHVYLHQEADTAEDLSLTRRAFMDLAPLSTDELSVLIEVLQ